MNFSADATKIISARIPMQEYIKLLTSATKLKLSVSEYLIWKVYYKDEKYKSELKIILEKLKAEYERNIFPGNDLKDAIRMLEIVYNNINKQ